MSIPSENTYENIQQEERYKKLERAVKLLKMQFKKKPCEVNPSESPWPSVSSINVDPLDTSCAGFSLHSSRIGSDVLASSRNMRQIQSRSNPLNIPQGMTTSSVKQFPTEANQQERVLMPPPKTIGILAHSSRRNSLAGPGPSKPTPPSSSGTDRGFPAQSVISSIKCSSSRQDYQTEFEKENYQDHHRPGVEMKPDRIFSKWRPILNDKGQLIIRGTLECGKVARSKPVIRRLSSVSVQSVFNHIYHLRGNIYDERHELPDYIRGKFYNGFPDDWENVYQVWSNFMTSGSRESFRWPTPITDSDDDLQSEISDITQVRRSKKRLGSSREPKELDTIRSSPRKHSSSMKNRKDDLLEEKLRESIRLSPRKRLKSSRDTRDRSPEASREDKKLLSPRRRLDSSREPVAEGVPENKSCCCPRDSISKSCDREGPNDTIENFMEKIKTQQMNSSATSLTPSSIGRLRMASLKDIIHEDKLKIILENLTSRKCSIEYIEKMIEMFDCIKYVVSYQSDDVTETHTEGHHSSNRCSHRDTPVLHPQESSNNHQKLSNPSEVTETQHRRANPPVRRKLSDDYDSSDGVDNASEEDRRPKLPVRLREKPLDQLRSTERRRHPESTVSESEDEVTSPKKRLVHPPSQVINDRTSAMKTLKTPGKPLVNYDSCVSLTEDERRPMKPPSHLLKPREKTPLKNLGFQLDSYDSSVSITDEEFGNDSTRRTEAKRQILQEANTKILKSSDGCIKRNFLKGSSQSDLPTVPQSTEKEQTRKEDLSDNKENQKSSRTLHSNEGVSKNIHEEIEEVSLERSPPEKKKKPVKLDDEKVTVKLSQILNLKSSSQGSNKDQNALKKDQNSLGKESSQDPVNPTPEEVEEKDLRVELEDIMKDKDSRRLKSSKESKKGEFGTDSNPKILTRWFPKLLKKVGGNYGLIFEGKLLNEAGHVSSRKFLTDFVLRRVNPQVIETEAHEFYQLTGELCDTKHTVPKEIQKLCLKGCPGKINHFCEKWRRLIEETSPEKREIDHNKTVDMIGVPTSSRGRRILPPLCYWTGERITLKDNTPVYSPGNTQESSLPSSMEMSFRKDSSGKDLSQNSSRRKDTSAKDTSVSSAWNNTSVKKGDKSGKTESSDQRLPKAEERVEKLKKSPVKSAQVGKSLRSTSKRRLPRDIAGDSSDGEEVERESRVKRRRRVRRGEGNSPGKAKEEQKEDVKNRGKNREDTRGGRPEKTKGQTPELTCTYRKNVPYRDDVLSDDQLSMI